MEFNTEFINYLIQHNDEYVRFTGINENYIPNVDLTIKWFQLYITPKICISGRSDNNGSWTGYIQFKTNHHYESEIDPVGNSVELCKFSIDEDLLNKLQNLHIK